MQENNNSKEKAYKRKYHYLYKTTCLITNKWYIGIHSTDNLEDRYLGSGKRLRYSINKYGEENHKKEILEYWFLREDLCNREREIVNEDLLKDPMCMNIAIGGGTGWNSVHKSGAYKVGAKNSAISYKNHVENDPEFKKLIAEKISERSKKAWKEGKFNHINHSTFIGKKHSEETLEKMRNSHQENLPIGNLNGKFGTCWIYHLELKENKSINKEDLEIWLNLGWIKGRKIKI